LSGNSSVNEGSLYSLTLGAITDPGSDTVDRYRVNWGDGNSEEFTSAGVKTHTYANDGNLTITVDLRDEDSAPGFHLSARSKVLTVNNVGTFLSGTLADSLVVDVNGNGLADPGDTIQYSASATNNG